MVSSGRRVVADAVDDLAQHLVAGGMAEIVVDPLEAVEIDEDAGELDAVSSALRMRSSSAASKPWRLRRPVR